LYRSFSDKVSRHVPRVAQARGTRALLDQARRMLLAQDDLNSELAAPHPVREIAPAAW
jgi:hypothetical protein